MINCITSRIEQTCNQLRRFGKKIFDVQELGAEAYHRKVGNTDIFTILDKNYNKLLVQNVRVKSAQEKESVTRIFSSDNERVYSVKSTIKKVS